LPLQDAKDKGMARGEEDSKQLQGIRKRHMVESGSKLNTNRKNNPNTHPKKERISGF
jgi:hypothetical protein